MTPTHLNLLALGAVTLTSLVAIAIIAKMAFRFLGEMNKFVREVTTMAQRTMESGRVTAPLERPSPVTLEDRLQRERDHRANLAGLKK